MRLLALAPFGRSGERWAFLRDRFHSVYSFLRWLLVWILLYCMILGGAWLLLQSGLYCIHVVIHILHCSCVIPADLDSGTAGQ